MSEHVQPPGHPLEDLIDILQRGESATPASYQDFTDLAALISTVADEHPESGWHSGSVRQSAPLRPLSASESSPRIVVMEDPVGKIYDGTNFAGSPVVELRIERGIDNTLRRQESGAWAMSVEVVNHNGQIKTNVVGAMHDGLGGTLPLTESGSQRAVASKDLLQWVAIQMVDPEHLQEAYTDNERKRLSSFVAKIGSVLFRRPLWRNETAR